MNGYGSTAEYTTQQRSQSSGAQSYYVHHEFDGAAEVTNTLAHAISDVTGMNVTDAEVALDDYVDLGALNRLFSPKSDGTPRRNGHVSFAIWGYQTTVYSSGQISIVPINQARPARA